MLPSQLIEQGDTFDMKVFIVASAILDKHRNSKEGTMSNNYSQEYLDDVWKSVKGE